MCVCVSVKGEGGGDHVCVPSRVFPTDHETRAGYPGMPHVPRPGHSVNLTHHLMHVNIR